MNPSPDEARDLATDIENRYRAAWYHLTEAHRAAIIDQRLLSALELEGDDLTAVADLYDWISGTREMVLARLAKRKLHVDALCDPPTPH